MWVGVFAFVFVSVFWVVFFFFVYRVVSEKNYNFSIFIAVSLGDVA